MDVGELLQFKESDLPRVGVTPPPKVTDRTPTADQISTVSNSSMPLKQGDSAAQPIEPPPVLQLPPAIVIPPDNLSVFPSGYSPSMPVYYLGSITVSTQNTKMPLSTMQILPHIPVYPGCDSRPSPGNKENSLPGLLPPTGDATAETAEAKLQKLGFQKPISSMIELAAKRMLQKPSKVKPSTNSLSQSSRVMTPSAKSRNSLGETSKMPSSALPQNSCFMKDLQSHARTIHSFHKANGSPLSSSMAPISFKAKKPSISFEIRMKDGSVKKSFDLKKIMEVILENLQSAKLQQKQQQMKGFKCEKPPQVPKNNLPTCSLQRKHEHFSSYMHSRTYKSTTLSGSARSEPFIRRRHRKNLQGIYSDSFLSSSEGDPLYENRLSSISAVAVPLENGHVPQTLPLSMHMSFPAADVKDSFVVSRSQIHGWGLFSIRSFEPGELIIEYTGELIRSLLSDKRERHYLNKGLGCYMFRLDDDWVIDATMKGNVARFINHSCNPNCYAEVLLLDQSKHILIFALKSISKGDELTYDYRFPSEEDKLPCKCKSSNCRKYLN